MKTTPLLPASWLHKTGQLRWRMLSPDVTAETGNERFEHLGRAEEPMEVNVTSESAEVSQVMAVTLLNRVGQAHRGHSHKVG